MSVQLEEKRKRKIRKKKAATPVTEDVGSFVLPDWVSAFFNAAKEGEDETALKALLCTACRLDLLTTDCNMNQPPIVMCG